MSVGCHRLRDHRRLQACVVEAACRGRRRTRSWTGRLPGGCVQDLRDVRLDASRQSVVRPAAAGTFGDIAMAAEQLASSAGQQATLTAGDAYRPAGPRARVYPLGGLWGRTRVHARMRTVVVLPTARGSRATRMCLTSGTVKSNVALTMSCNSSGLARMTEAKMYSSLGHRIALDSCRLELPAARGAG